ncbi:hypothetical protein A2Y83_05395 [Candidatus Falkowbacteria bacterium RBG_13_39_14]|uniref:Uncharacterized protein n=1 Tax=Candidatus Falkowbacteria bacterium RBG_13_39_14 TaxID=1797985 RepID=A0A1F5S261_9BACT|nr:MAG: hypothetical protein A2Y83_05395 [Candidatus Falkowbacteria bacterium RBG_13_39_14]
MASFRVPLADHDTKNFGVMAGRGIPWRERWTRYSALIQGIPRRFAPRDDASTRCVMRVAYFIVQEFEYFGYNKPYLARRFNSSRNFCGTVEPEIAL